MSSQLVGQYINFTNFFSHIVELIMLIFTETSFPTLGIYIERRSYFWKSEANLIMQNWNTTSVTSMLCTEDTLSTSGIWHVSTIIAKHAFTVDAKLVAAQLEETTYHLQDLYQTERHVNNAFRKCTLMQHDILLPFKPSYLVYNMKFEFLTETHLLLTQL